MKLFRCKYMIPSCYYCSAAAAAAAADDDDLEPSGSKVADVEEEEEEINFNSKDSIIRQFDAKQINSLVTKNSAVIAEGGFSTVYLASLPSRSSSSPVAATFKVHDQFSERLYRMFCQERDVLLKVNHPNIVRLLGYSDDGEAAGVLVFEHFPNGTLHGMLQSSKFTLSWPKRMSIAFQLATALEYLHEGCDLQIIHGDVKASNVLLDRNLSPKLCDFGFARMGFSATVTRSAKPMMGSPGYVDPHYLTTGLVSKKSDVYSFGVLILELITGMEAFCEEKSRMLTTVMRPRLQEISGVGEMVDRKLNREYDEAEVGCMAKIAAQCIGENLSLQPSMGEILKIMREKVPSATSAFGMIFNGKKDI